MWKYEKKLEYPINIKKKDLKMAKAMLAQYGGPDGEWTAAMRYLNQRYSMPDERGYALLNDIGTEEMAHVEMIGTMVYQLMDNASIDQIKAAGLAGHYADHGKALFYTDATGNPWTATYIQAKGDVIADIHENMAAEQKARTTYDNLLRLIDDPDVRDPIKFLREREIVHYQRFGEGLQLMTDKLDSKNFYAFNPNFDKHCMKNNNRRKR
jgi:spore coat protein JC